eukprot:s52_g34.t1
MAAAIAVMQHPHAEDEDEDSDYFQRITQVTAHGGDRQVSAGGQPLDPAEPERLGAQPPQFECRSLQRQRRWPAGLRWLGRQQGPLDLFGSCGERVSGLTGGWAALRGSLNDLHLYETEAGRAGGRCLLPCHAFLLRVERGAPRTAHPSAKSFVGA